MDDLVRLSIFISERGVLYELTPFEPYQRFWGIMHLELELVWMFLCIIE